MLRFFASPHTYVGSREHSLRYSHPELAPSNQPLVCRIQTSLACVAGMRYRTCHRSPSIDNRASHSLDWTGTSTLGHWNRRLGYRCHTSPIWSSLYRLGSAVVASAVSPVETQDRKREHRHHTSRANSFSARVRFPRPRTQRNA